MDNKQPIFLCTTVAFTVRQFFARFVRLSLDNGHPVSVLCAEAETLNLSGVVCIDLPWQRRKRDLLRLVQSYVRIKNTLESESVYISNTLFPNLVGLMLKLGGERFTWVVVFTGQTWRTNGRWSNCLRALDLAFFKFGDRFVCDSFEQRRFLQASGFEGKPILVPNIGSICGIADIAARAELGKRRLGTEVVRPKGIELLVFGRVSSEKNYRFSINLCAELIRRGNQATVTFVGPAEFPDEDLWMFGLPWVRAKFGEFDWREVFKCDSNSILLIASLREGFCMVGVESLSMAYPVVASELSVLVDTLGSNGQVKFFPADNLECACEVVESVFEQGFDREALAKGMAFVNSHFEPDLMANYLYECFFGDACGFPAN